MPSSYGGSYTMKIHVRRGVWRPVAVVAVLTVMASVQGDWAPTPVSAALPTVPHYKCYAMPGASPGVSKDLQTQFGLDPDVVVGPVSSLCLPAIKEGQGSLTEPHLRCYNISAGTQGHNVSIETQFGLESGVLLGKATKLCVPANKAVFPNPPPPVVPPVPHYECYQIERGGSDPPVTVGVRDQFYATPQSTVVGPATSLCLPALKNGEGSLTVTHIECYQISGPLPGKSVNLLTQFGEEMNMPVGEPQELCVPAIKKVRVGGEQALPDVSSASPAGESSGSSARTYGALAGAIAAGLVAVSAGALYARRRWLR